MNKLTYLAELAEGLARWVPERERQDILRYYAEYFEEAGPGKEAQVVQELGDPWALSCRLAVEGGYVTQEKADAWTWTAPKKRKVWPWVLTAACVVIVAVSVAWAFSGVGRWLGGLVRFHSSGITVVEEGAAVAAGDVEFTRGFWNAADGTLDPFTAIDADIDLGSLTITGGDDYTLAIQYPNSLSGYSPTWEVKNGTLKIRDNRAPQVRIGGWDEFRDLFGDPNGAMEVIVTVPEGTLLEELTAKTDLGNLFLSDLYAKKAEAKTDMGNVEGYELRAQKKLELKTDLGDVSLSLVEPYEDVKIELKTSMGQIEANLDCPERDCRYEVKTGLGQVTVNGQPRGDKAQRDSGGPYRLTVDNGMGDVNVYFSE